MFDQDARCVSYAPRAFTSTISDNWSINAIPNGGYLMALLANAMMQCSQMTSTPVITANFINRCVPGEAQVLVDKMVTSKQFDRMQARLIQNQNETTRAFGTFASESNECVLESYETSSPEIAAREHCVPIPRMATYTLFDQLDIRLDPECTGWVAGKLTPVSAMKGWVKFKSDRMFDIMALLLVADAFPPAILISQGMVAWVPTIEFSVNVRRLPRTKWLKCLFRTRFITCGLLEEDGEIWDQNGELAAISRQIAQYRIPSK